MNAKEAKRMYEQYVRRNVVEPMYARVMIEWHDDKSLSNATIALFPFDNGLRVSEMDDERIFFYADGLDEFLRLYDESAEDFVIRQLYGFSNTL